MSTQLIVDNYIIKQDIMEILNKLKSELSNGKLNIIDDRGEYVRVTCPIHHEGHENRPSCSVYYGPGNLEFGYFNCFTCGNKGHLYEFISHCFDKSVEYGKRWLVKNFSESLIKNRFNELDFNLIQPKPEIKFIDEKVLETFESYHPYMKTRKLSDDVITKFEIKYDKDTQTLVFPVRDKKGKLLYLTRRSVNSKKFIIDKGIKKEVYLLYNVLKNKPKEVYITESQINALVCESYGKSAVAMFGCGCPDYQIKDLNLTDVKHYIIAFDPDKAGLEGTIKLCRRLLNSKFVSVMILPKGKDVGDLTEEEFNNCKIVDRSEFINNIPEYYTK